ncbi:SRPBCC family protein [Sciscionella sediminilitoris]|uniref:SRPBCC family protein n=1 Tax=Sciscionella sediminilitoris TaxID=1445613 RepID=UPI0004DEF959|nr:SRPBCC family protein [Sciscionella sp. SE31]
MPQSKTTKAPLFRVRADIRVSASPGEVYAVVSDMPRAAEWSAECRGGTWVSGAPATVGSVFRGRNHREPDVVGWAPVVRGDWTTDAEVIAAEPGRVFRWAIRTKAGTAQDSVWSFELAAAGSGCVLTHAFHMGTATEGIRSITAEMTEAEQRRFFTEWGAKLERDITATLERIKNVIEKR